MFESSIPEPYRSAWDAIRGAGGVHAREYAERGVPVHMRQVSPGPAVAPSEEPIEIQQYVTMYDYWLHLRIPEILDRVCGVVSGEEILRVDQYYRLYPIRRQRQLCPEYRAALDVMTYEHTAGACGQFMSQGIVVPDSAYQGSRTHFEQGTVRVAPLEVFVALNRCGLGIPPELTDFYIMCRQWEFTYGTPASERQAYASTTPTAAVSLVDIQRSYNEILNTRLDHEPPRYLSWGNYAPSYEPFLYPSIDPRSLWETEPLTPEQIEAREKASREAKDAKERGMQLLERVVTPEELQSYKDNKYIEVDGKQYRYRIKAAGQTALYGKESCKVEYNACLQLTDTSAPSEDRVVMEYLMIRNKEKKYLKEANLFSAGLTTFESLNNSVLNRMTSAIADTLFSSSPIFERIRGR